MNRIALKMLFGDRAKFFGIVLGLTFASLLITQQSAIFVGVMSRVFGTLTDLSLPDVWVMDPKVQFIEDLKPLSGTMLYRVRGVPGVGWAVPLYKGLLKARLTSGNFQTCNVLGLDDATLIGGPPRMLEGSLADLRRSEGVILDAVGARTKLARVDPATGASTPLRRSDTLELNDHRAVVVGICEVTRTFQSQPVLYTTYSRAMAFAPRERRLLSFILVKAAPGTDPERLATAIAARTGLVACTVPEFKRLTVMYVLKNTGIPINLGIAVVLAFVIGTAIAGQAFYSFTLDNLRYLGTLKAMGATEGQLLDMVVVQALTVGCIGYGIGVGTASLIGQLARRTELAFRLPWQLLVVSALAVGAICALAALVSLRRVAALEPAVVFRG